MVLAGFCAFVTLYAPQPILPMLAGIFHANSVMISLMITSSTLGVALAAPVMGQVADRIGRKRIIVLAALTLGAATLMITTSTTLGMLLFWRFIQGIATPGVFSVTTAYVHDEWPPDRAPAAISAYVSGTVIGGFSGRVLVGFVAEHWGWHPAFAVLGVISLSIAGYLAIFLPVESKFAPAALTAGVFDSTVHHVAEHLRNPRLRAAYAIGFCVLFTQIALFTYVTFQLAAPPFSLKPGFLGSIFVVYLGGAIVTPLAGRRIGKDGHPRMLIFASVLGAAGALLTLAPNLWSVIAGLTLCSSGVFIAQASATSFVGTAAARNRALALGLYVTFYYIGGSFGGTVPGWLWSSFGWPGCVALIVAVQVAIAWIARGIAASGIAARGTRQSPIAVA